MQESGLIVVLKKLRPEFFTSGLSFLLNNCRAGDGTRTHDILLGKQTFYH